MTKPPKRTYSRSLRVGRREQEILNELRAGDMLIGFLCSARSSKRMFRIARERARERYLTKHAAYRLISRGFVVRRGDSLSLSRHGRSLLEASVAATRLRLTKDEWDGKWRIVIYDIPNTLDHLRYRIRSVLARSGFLQLQKSVWIFPHECRELADLIRKDRRTERHIMYATIDALDDDTRLRSHFKLG